MFYQPDNVFLICFNHNSEPATKKNKITKKIHDNQSTEYRAMLMNAVQANARQYFFIRVIWTIQREEDLRKD